MNFFKNNFLFLCLLFASIILFLRCAQTTAFNRNPAQIIYTKHARCRMGCRNINETEVKEILQNGNINYNKSELNGDACYQKFAVEGYTNENQHLRIIFAPCGNKETVVTVIDLGYEWNCNCY